MSKTEEIVRFYQDKKNWRPPTLSQIAEKFGITKMGALYHVRKLSGKRK